MILKYGIKVRKKSFGFPVPELLNSSIDAMIQAINSDDSLTDCYMAELYNDINNCLHSDITDEQANELRDYYLRGGMYEDR